MDEGLSRPSAGTVVSISKCSLKKTFTPIYPDTFRSLGCLGETPYRLSDPLAVAQEFLFLAAASCLCASVCVCMCVSGKFAIFTWVYLTPICGGK
jgi:hypothetical protein